MNTISFNPDYVNGFANAKAFIDDYTCLNTNHALTDEQLTDVYNSLKTAELPEEVDHCVYVAPEVDC